MQLEINSTVHDKINSTNWDMYGTLPLASSFQASLSGFLLLEIVLGVISNLTVLVLYCTKLNLINSVSNIITMNVHILDVIICVGCIPLTIAIIFLPPERNTALICSFHEAGVSFASVGTAVNVLAISLDRYDICVKPAKRILNLGRAIILLTSVWIVSFFAFLIPFMEVSFLNLQNRESIWQNKTLFCIDLNGYCVSGMYYHLLVHIPIFFLTVLIMLITYSKIMQALNISIGSHFSTGQKKTKTKATPLIAQNEDANLAETNVGHNIIFGMRTSVSVIIALRRAVKRHRERRKRQKRVFRMSLLIISTFLICWIPISILNTVILHKGPSDCLMKVRLCFLTMAYGTTVFHPLLYAFTRQKFQKVLKSKMKKRVVSIVIADPIPNNILIHNSWIESNRKITNNFCKSS